jgi:hypothetical protein
MVAVDRKSNQIALIQHAAKWLICIDLVFARVVKHNNRAFALSTEPGVRGKRDSRQHGFFAGV